MSLIRKKKEVMSLIARMDESHLDALLLLLREPLGENYPLSDAEWAETDKRREEASKDKSKLVPARAAVRRIESRLKKRSK